jgi:hypothetical protein
MSLTAPALADPRAERALRRDLRLLADFIELHCQLQHRNSLQHNVQLKTHDVEALCRRPIRLCSSCQKLLTHAFVKRTRCPLDPKPACKKCPTHCYGPGYRAQIREVMKYSGRRLVLRGRLDYLYHLFF